MAPKQELSIEVPPAVPLSRFEASPFRSANGQPATSSSLNSQTATISSVNGQTASDGANGPTASSSVNVQIVSAGRESDAKAATSSVNGPPGKPFGHFSTTSLDYLVGSATANSSSHQESESGPSLNSRPHRTVYVRNPERTNDDTKYSDNFVRTSKYTLITFLPKNLFEQFRRLAYVYFAIIAILNQIPALAVFGRTASLFPLIFVLVVTGIKDAYEDWGRHKSDRKVNNSMCSVMENGNWTQKKWKKVRAGEVVKLGQDEVVPADIVLLETSHAQGLAYTETMNLDGETNLKSRYAHVETSKTWQTQNTTIICEPPNRNIYEFLAYLELENNSQLPLGPQNMLLRGCVLRNTEWVVGVVVYAGRETKAMLNNSGAQSKRSKLEHQMNRETMWLALILLILCAIGTIGMAVFINDHDVHSLPYFGAQDNYKGSAGEPLLNYFSLIIVFQILIPISLYISMELVRLGQAFLMRMDRQMYHEPTNTRFKARALNINEDLGQIHYVFSDKTGTLTQNSMVFHAASIGGNDYSHSTRVEANAPLVPSTPLSTPPPVPPTGNSPPLMPISPGDLKAPLVNPLPASPAGTPTPLGPSTPLGPGPGQSPPSASWQPALGAMVDSRLVGALEDANRAPTIKDFLLVLAACNTAVPTVKRADAELNVNGAFARRSFTGETVGAAVLLEYQCESPDEQALVTAAAAYGVTLLERTSQDIVIDVQGTRERYDVLGIHDFDSSRKRMSVVLRGPDGRARLLCKGADTVLFPLLSTHQHQEIGVATQAHLDAYAREGLRTLVVAIRTLETEEVLKWQEEYQRASTAMLERSKALADVAAALELNLQLLGATGIEDKLQDGVPDTIALLRAAGIKVWMLTGDKQETAISIAFSCQLLSQEMEQIVVNETTKEGTEMALRQAAETHNVRKYDKKKRLGFRGWLLRALGWYAPERPDVPGGTQPERQLALVIDGQSLVHALSEELEEALFHIAVNCRAVVCCRVAPLQKAGVVALIKNKVKEMTLAIGDGANDVSMIQMADVGVGISGQEGRQAVMASDFAIAQFRFLGRLLIVHGHWHYQRLAYMVLYNFYRNAVFIFLLFWFILYNGYSAQSALSDWNLVFYSLIYTSVPTIVVGILDQDVSQKTLLLQPPLYQTGQKDVTYNKLQFWIMMVDMVWQSLVLFFGVFWAYFHSNIGIWALGNLWTVAVVLVVSLHLAMDTYMWTWINHVVLWGSILVMVICLLIMDAMLSMPQYWVFYHVLGDARYWLTLILIPIVALGPRYIVRVVSQRWFPSELQIAREKELLRSVGINRLDEGARSPATRPLEMGDVAATSTSRSP